MTPVIQTKVVVRNSNNEIVVNGNCYAAAIASMLDLPITEVPNVEVFFPWSSENRFWDDWMNKWLELKGYKIEDASEFKIFHEDKDLSFEQCLEDLDAQKDRLRGQYYFVSGDSPRGVKHICIYQDGKLVHDPHPTKDGIFNHLWFEKLVKLI